MEQYRQAFAPFVITLIGGEAYPVSSLEDFIVGLRTVVVRHSGGLLLQIPFSAILHISEKGEQLG